MNPLRGEGIGPSSKGQHDRMTTDGKTPTKSERRRAKVWPLSQVEQVADQRRPVLDELLKDSFQVCSLIEQWLAQTIFLMHLFL